LNFLGLLVFVGLLIGLLAAVQSAAAADSSDANNPAVHYSTGKSGSRLTWLSQRAESADDENTVTPVQYTAPIDPRGPARATPNLRPTPDPLGNPFGDQKPSTSASGVKTGRALLTTMPIEPKVGKSLPALPSETLTTTAMPSAPSTDLPSLGDVKPKSDENRSAAQRRDLASQYDVNQPCPSPKDLKKIGELTTNIAPSEGAIPQDCPFGEDVFQPRAFPQSTFTWTASALCHKPLYFEDVQVERYGHMWGPLLQPIMSGANFFLTVPALPYKMGLEPPNECVYALGYYRPGDCAPYLLDPLPLSVRGALWEASAWTGGAFLFP
jgi:hypothetical protein